MVEQLGLSRINVIGTSGSGKSTFSRRLAELLAIPYIEIDQLYWEPNWGEPSDEVFFARLEQALRGDQWVLDGNYHRTQPIKWQRAQTVIWLDYSLARTLTRMIKRSFSRALTERELWPGTGNRETLSALFSRKSMVLWSYQTHPIVKARYGALFARPEPAHVRFVRLRSPREAERFLATVLAARAPHAAREQVAY